VVTLDEHDRVVDANEAAQDLFDVVPGYEGMPAHVFFEKVPDRILLELADAKNADTKITTRIDGEQRHFSLSISPIDSEREQHGRVIVLQDVTDLKQREQELDVLRQVQSRVLRHNIRTELSMVRGHAEMVASQVDEKQQQRMESIVEAGNRLATISDKARVVEELFEDEQSPREYDLRASVEEAVGNIRAEYPELSVSVTGANTCQATASPHLQTAVENLLENAAMHNPAENPRATIHLSNGSKKQLTVSDNGPGIPDQELTVLEKGSEDALEHGSGLGLWLVKWIADRSDADLEFETGDDGTDVRLQFS
jgi:signal transduction histidine kinase